MFSGKIIHCSASQLFPTTEVAEVVLVLFLKGFGINMVVLLKRTEGHRESLHTYLLKETTNPLG